jgi:hypothetical protein
VIRFDSIRSIPKPKISTTSVTNLPSLPTINNR